MTQIEKKQCQNSNLEQDNNVHLKYQQFWFMVLVQANYQMCSWLVSIYCKTKEFQRFVVQVASISNSMLNIWYVTKM